MKYSASAKRTLAIILGGGRGTRLYPLTKMRAKPAVPLGGAYRLIDVPVSNCINSEINRIFVLTQFNSASLNRHLFQSYSFDAFRGGFVEMLAAEQTIASMDWFQGTADAVRRNLWHFAHYDFDYYLILAGDHLYRMDYQKFVDSHMESSADITVAVHPVVERDASAFGILKADSRGYISDFVEKPTDKKILNSFKQVGQEKSYLASMGIYVFTRKVLHDILEDKNKSDFGKDIIPSSLKKYKVHSYMFKGYWQDIGTIRSFYEANLALALENSPFEFSSEGNIIYTHPRFLPGTKIRSCSIKNTLVTGGCELIGASIENSVIGIRSTVHEGAKLSNVVMMGADEELDNIDKAAKKDTVGVGKDSIIENAIIDKNASIGKNVQLINKKRQQHFDGSGVAIRDGIIVIEKNAVIPDGFVL